MNEIKTHVKDKIINDKHCFELYGYDVLFDEEMRVWLIEVNASPSFGASSEEDKEMKVAVIEDTMNVVDMENKLLGTEKRIGGYDLLDDTGESFLGCDNSDREIQLGRIFREAQMKQE